MTVLLLAGVQRAVVDRQSRRRVATVRAGVAESPVRFWSAMDAMSGPADSSRCRRRWVRARRNGRRSCGGLIAGGSGLGHVEEDQREVGAGEGCDDRGENGQ